MATNYWTEQEIRTIIDSMTPEMGSIEIKELTKSIYRSEMAINAKILELIGIKLQSKLVKDIVSEYIGNESFDDSLFNGEFPNIDKNFIPSNIFASVLTNRKLKMVIKDRILFRSYEDIYRMTCYSDNMKSFIVNTSNVYSIAGVYGKSFWLKEDLNEYPIQFHVDLIRKLIKLN
jgi:hypothetical protein